MKREVVRMVAIVALATLPLLPSTSQASAIGASNPPAYTSWYMNTVNTNTLYNMGCSRGTSDKNVSGTQHSTVIFDYGQPVYDTSKGYGASGFHQDTYFNTSEIAAAIEIGLTQMGGVGNEDEPSKA